MASSTEVCNIGLSKIGEDPILNLSEDSRAGRACNLIYEPMRKALLRAHNWNFSIKRVQLALIVDTPDYGFGFKFQLPADFLKLIGTSWDDYLDVKFKVEGSTIVTDASTFSITYVTDFTDVNNFDSLFSEALSTRISAELAIILINDTDLKLVMMEEYKEKFGEAKSSDAQDNMTDEFVTSTWVNSRI